MKELLRFSLNSGEEGIEAAWGVGPDCDFPFEGPILFSFHSLLVPSFTEGKL